MPQFSILIPVYNADEYIRKCLDSIINQSFGDFEVVLLDDGSTDGSNMVMKEYANIDSRFRIYEQDNKGIFSARYFLMQKAKGNYVIFCDADDWLRQDALEIINNILVKFQADLVLFNHYKVSTKKNEEVITEEPFIKGKSEFVDKKFIVKQLLTSFSLNQLWNKTVKRELIDVKKYKDYLHIIHGEDLIISLPWLFTASKVYYLRDSLYFYRRSDNGTSLTSKIIPYRFRVLNETRSIMLEYVKDYLTADDIKVFANFYYFSVCYCLPDIILGITDRKKIVDIFDEIKNADIYITLRKYAAFNVLPFRFRIQLILLENGKYSLLILFEKMLGEYRKKLKNI